ncbi:efflux RND transporter periplasmic adaptor subunit [Flavisphingomonas formosensis]|uniref:efflux RND transporter periplasmic adaptor subunit n=1 Tax=Flavisphingomonas formosensis TaxID=861534 RepID=UPI0012F865BE|nr:efflux RND transporter periplasmic adaptor subunit [Sphingomonas formosensis]
MKSLVPTLRAGSIGLTIALAACGAQQQPAPPPPEVNVVTIQPQAIANVVELPGRVQAVRTAEVRARVDGIVERRLYEEGSDVRAGAPLFRIDPRPLAATYNAARAALARAQATATNAQQVVNRYTPLVSQQAVSKQEYDAAVATERQSQADVAQARAQVDSARLNLDYAAVTAPIAGRVGRAEVTEGALVSASQATLMTRIEQLDPIYVNFSQSNSELMDLRRDIASGRINIPSLDRVRVSLVLEDGSVYGLTGHLNFLDMSVDETTGSVSLRAEFPNPQRTLLPGQFVRARIQAGVAPGGVAVPQRSVMVTPQGASVMVVGKGNIAEARTVKLGGLQGGQWVILDGLKPGERVITDGVIKAKAGQPVTIAKPGSKPAGPGNPAGQR